MSIERANTNQKFVGNREVLAQEKFIIRNNESATLDLWDNGVKFRVVLAYSIIPPRKTVGESTPLAGAAFWQVIPDGVKITFQTLSHTPILIKGSSSLGRFVDGGNLEFDAEVYRYADSFVIFIQLMKNKGA